MGARRRATVAELARRGSNVAGLLVTIAANVPLNDALAAGADDPAAVADPAAVRGRFERAWNVWNTARTVLTLAALACLGAALLS